MDRLVLIPFPKLCELLSDYEVSRALSDWEKTLAQLNRNSKIFKEFCK